MLVYRTVGLSRFISGHDSGAYSVDLPLLPLLPLALKADMSVA